MRKNVMAILGLTLLTGVLGACDRNPLKADRDKGLYMYTNPSFAQLAVGKTTKVRANVMNKYLAPTGDAVTGTPCDAKITAVSDTSRTVFEQPERFVVTGVAAGTTCLIVSGGGVTDTVQIVVQ
jgi:hypothetical protein